MTIELLPSDLPQQKGYYVEVNYCKCHPETCCCNDWNVVDDIGNFYASFFHKRDAERLVSLLNKSEPCKKHTGTT